MKFSIGIPAYKAAFLKECIESILAQTYKDFELIIINDASPENIDEVVELYKSQNKITYYKNKENYGPLNVVDNWNNCLSYAKGEFFILMGDDDKMCINYLEEFSTLIEKYPKCNVYHCRSIIINEKSAPINFTEPRPEFESVYDSILQRIQGKRIFFISDYVYRTENLKTNGGFYKLPLAWASDDISSYIATEQNGIAHTNNPVFMYRRNRQTISSNGNVYLKMAAILQEEKWLYKFLEINPKNYLDVLLRENIRNEMNMYIRKKKIFTIYSSKNISIINLLFRLKEFNLSITELVFSSLMIIKETSIKKRYKNF